MPTPAGHPQDDPRTARLAYLRRERDEVEASLPQHSVPAAMLVRLEDLEEEITALEVALNVRAGDDNQD